MPRTLILERKVRTNVYNFAEIYQAQSVANRRGECRYNIHGRVEPVCEPVTTAPRLAEFRDLPSQQLEDGIGSIAGLEPSEKWI